MKANTILLAALLTALAGRAVAQGQPPSAPPRQLVPPSATAVTPDQVTPDQVTPDQVTPDQVTPDQVTPGQVAAAQAEADRLIAAAGAEGYFIDVTDGAEPKVKHLPSGLECVFTPGQTDNRIRLDPASAAPGEAFTCQTFDPMDGGGAINVIHAERKADPPALDRQLDALEAALRARLPGARPLAGAYAGLSLSLGQGAVEHRAARFRAAHPGEGGQFFERVAVGAAGGWTVSQTVTAPLEDADTADLEGELTLSLALLKIQQAAAGPTASPVP